MAYNGRPGLPLGNRGVNDDIGPPEQGEQETVIQAVAGGRDFGEMVDEWGRQSFPASDPPSNW